MAGKQCTLEQALHCAKCKTIARFAEECSDPCYELGEIVLVQCPNYYCREKPWFYCKTCTKKCYRNCLTKHSKTQKHVLRHANIYKQPRDPTSSSSSNKAPDPPASDDTTVTKRTPSTVFPDFPDDLNNDINSEDLEFVGMDTEAFHEQMNKDLSTTHIKNATSSMDIMPPPTTNSNTPIPPFPRIRLEGNEWLADAFKDTPRATVQEIFHSFSSPEMEPMKNFWVAELGSGEGRCGGGIVYLCARTFQQNKDSQLDSFRYPDFDAAKWHVRNCIQHHSMTDKQRRRQANLNDAITKELPADSFLRHTFVPKDHQLNRYYGHTGQHSMWNNLPCPRAVDVDGVAYVSPKATIAYVIANGIPIDDFLLNTQGKLHSLLPQRCSGKVHHTCQSKKAINWIDDIRKAYYGARNTTEDSDSKNGAPKLAVVLVPVSDWCDGFGPGKVKNNRNSVDLKTFTISPPKHLVNGTNNTFPVAMGLKKSTVGWKKVERMFRAEIEELTASKEPIMFYSGVLQRRIPFLFKRFAVISDKAERNGLTGTLGCGSNIHRCFGISGLLQTPSCNVQEIQRQLQQEQSGAATAPEFGWSDKYVYQNSNGAIFPSCVECRKAGLNKIGIQFEIDYTPSDESCVHCTNWELLPPKDGASLDFPAHKDYPKAIAEGSPIAAPEGRDVFGVEDQHLPFVRLGWDVMKQASKFAFYQASRPKKAWTKSATSCYLKHCGLSGELAESLFAAAKACSKHNQQDTISYDEEDRIGNFEFPAAWLSNEVSMQDYIEAIMHQLFLGITSSNFELLLKWLADAPAATKLGVSPFKNALQSLIKDLRPFMLSWLAAYPLTGKKGNLGTGSWVAENYIFFARISQFITGWCTRDSEKASCYGVDDMSRMVISFHALVARLLTHGGIDDKHIAETSLYLKEFLSAVREFDIRVRNKNLNADVRKASEAKATEAWWMKPNYMSLFNLIAMMILLGPLVEYWDGGGKGERFIQVVKPLIKRGIREDTMHSFFVNLMNKIFRMGLLDHFEEFYGFDSNGNVKVDENHGTTILEFILSELSIHNEGVASNVSDGTGSRTEGPADDDDEDEDTQLEDDACFSPSEVRGMAKKKTFYVYRNEHQLDNAVAAVKPLSGIVTVGKKDNTTIFEFKLIYRKPVKLFAQKTVNFADSNGIHFHGLWCSEVTVVDSAEQPTKSFSDIQSVAKLAAVAIPLWYVIGKDQPNSNKYCVITNWWKHRMQDGWYRLPTLDASLYGGEFRPETNSNDGDDDHSEFDVDVRMVNGMEYGNL